MDAIEVEHLGRVVVHFIELLVDIRLVERSTATGVIDFFEYQRTDFQSLDGKAQRRAFLEDALIHHTTVEVILVAFGIDGGTTNIHGIDARKDAFHADFLTIHHLFVVKGFIVIIELECQVFHLGYMVDVEVKCHIHRDRFDFLHSVEVVEGIACREGEVNGDYGDVFLHICLFYNVNDNSNPKKKRLFIWV